MLAALLLMAAPAFAFIVDPDVLSRREAGLSKEPTFSPHVQWKYDWLDGNRNNTIGAARQADPVPLPVPPNITPSGYSPQQILKAYGLTNSPTAGSGQTIVIVDAYGGPSVQSDFSAFNTQFGLPDISLDIRYPMGHPTSQNSGWLMETCLDVEWAHALAPGAKIILLIAPDNSYSNILGCVQYATKNLNPTAISLSLGGSESPGSQTQDSYFPAGFTYTISTGDSGAGVEYPSSTPNSLAVGGTSLYYNSKNSTFSEHAWSGSGGGVSQFEPIPNWQVGSVPSKVARCVPDVSLVADPYTGVAVMANGGWYKVGGTSLSAPCWAGIIARRAANTGGNHVQAFYQYYKSQYSQFFNDIVIGNTGLPAKKGYDLATGVGSPIGSAIVSGSGGGSGSIVRSSGPTRSSGSERSGGAIRSGGTIRQGGPQRQ